MQITINKKTRLQENIKYCVHNYTMYLDQSVI